MKLGINIRNWGPTATTEFLRACAEAADRSALDAIWFNDHLGLPPKIENNVYGIPEDMGTIVDPLGFACYLAACTERIAFGTGVLVIPYRPPIVTSKLLSTIQILSGDRFLLGIGPGYLDEEFKALGVPRNKRGKITDDMLDFFHACADNEVIEQHGQPLVLAPKLNCPPIYVGGGPQVAIPRAVKRGDGWMPVGMLPDDLKPHVEDLQAQARDAGRSELEVVAMKTLPLESPAEANEMAQAYQAAGVTHLVHTQGYESPAEFSEVADQVGRDIRATL